VRIRCVLGDKVMAEGRLILRQIITTDPAVMKHVLLDDFETFPKGV
jgi:hypothetical protein